MARLSERPFYSLNGRYGSKAHAYALRTVNKT